MAQFNLLPDVKLQYVKSRRLMRLVTLGSIGAAAAGIFVLLLLLVTVDVIQKNSLSDLNDGIKSNTHKLQNVPDLNTILTVQNQLNTLTGLHNDKPVTSQLFKYLSQITPNDVKIASLQIDFTADTLSLTGSAPSLQVINGFVDTLKQTNYHTDADKTDVDAFNTVVLSSFGRSTTDASYSISLNFDHTIFSNDSPITLTVPPGTSGNTGILFQKETGK